MSVTIKNGITPEINVGDTKISSTTPDTVSPGTRLGTYHIAAHPEMFEPQRSNTFTFVVTNIDGIVRAGMTGTEDELIRVIKNAQEIISLSVVSTPVPHFTQDVIEIRRGNSVVKYAGVPSFSSGRLVVNDWIGADTKSVLMAWQNLSYDTRTEKVGLASQYKKDCTLVEYSPDGQVVRQWTLYGCWISGIEEPDYNKEDGGKRQITATIVYDRGEIDTSGLM